MKSYLLRGFGLLLLAGLSLGPALGQNQKNQKKEERDAAKYYDKWLNEDVVYIITEEEREVFKSLTSDDERDQFIEQFWQRRDPDPSTPAHEFREEHYRRLAYANAHFGSGIPGWKTDRGRIYIMFGEPAQIEYSAGGGTYVRKPWEGGGRTATFPFEVWRYRHIDGVGDDVEIEFVDRSFSGEYKLAFWPWEKDMLLHVDGLGETNAERLGLAKRNYRPGLHPGNLNNTYFMTRFMGARFKDRPFEVMRQYYALQKPPAIQQKELKSIVDTRISYDKLPVRSNVDYYWIDDESAVVPITIEIPNRNLTYVPRENEYKARVGVYGRITSIGGKILGEFDQVVASVLPQSAFDAGKLRASLYQHSTLLPAGRYKLELVAQDLESAAVGTETRTIDLTEPPEEEKLVMGPIVLAEELATLDQFPENPETFVVGDVRVVPRVSRKFKPGEKLGIYVQVYNPTLDSASFEPSVSVDYSITKGDEVVAKFSDPKGSSVHFFSARRLILMNRIGLGDVQEGRYRLSVKINDSISGQTSTAQADFEISKD